MPLQMFLDHVVIYGLALFVVCVCVCGVHACVYWCSAFFAFEPAACNGSHVESNSVMTECRRIQQ